MRNKTFAAIGAFLAVSTLAITGCSASIKSTPTDAATMTGAVQPTTAATTSSTRPTTTIVPTTKPDVVSRDCEQTKATITGPAKGTVLRTGSDINIVATVSCQPTVDFMIEVDKTNKYYLGTMPEYVGTTATFRSYKIGGPKLTINLVAGPLHGCIRRIYDLAQKSGDSSFDQLPEMCTIIDSKIYSVR